MTTDLRNALEEIAAMTYDARTNGARAGEIARAALAAAPSTSPAAVPTVEYVEGSWMAVAAPSASRAEAPAEPVAWQERQATRNGWSAWYHLDKAPSDAAMAARDDYQWRPLYAAAPSAPQPKTAPVAHFIESSPGHWHQAAREYIGTEGVIPLYAQPVAPAWQAAAGVQGEKPNRNDPVSALAIRAIVAKGYCTQEQADECFSWACDALEAEAARMNEELPWVTRVPAQAVVRGVAEERAAFEAWVGAQTTGRLRNTMWHAWQARAALSTAGKGQA